MRLHPIHEYLLDPPHKVTVALIGCGGTGSQVLSLLARMNLAMVNLGHPGFHVTVFDDDMISEANIGRQLFSASEIGSYKAISLVTRFNRFYGTNWQAKPRKFGFGPSDTAKGIKIEQFNIYITCIDDYESRLTLSFLFKEKVYGSHSTKKLYWLDFGNTNNTGQAILGTLYEENEFEFDDEEDRDQESALKAGAKEKFIKKLPCFDQWASQFNPPKPSENTPSCSLAEALEKQDLLINSSLANSGMQLLWRLFREGKTPYHGVIINLETLTSNPIHV